MGADVAKLFSASFELVVAKVRELEVILVMIVPLNHDWEEMFLH